MKKLCMKQQNDLKLFLRYANFQTFITNLQLKNIWVHVKWMNHKNKNAHFYLDGEKLWMKMIFQFFSTKFKIRSPYVNGPHPPSKCNHSFFPETARECFRFHFCFCFCVRFQIRYGISVFLFCLWIWAIKWCFSSGPYQRFFWLFYCHS